MSNNGGGVSAGGPRISSAKRKRLAALEQSLKGAAAGVASTSPGALPRAGSSPSLRQAGCASAVGRRRGDGGGGSMGRAASSGSMGDQQQSQQQQQQPAEPLYRRLDEGIACGPAAEALQLPRPDANTQVVTSLLEQLMATNPRAFDARAAIGLKLQDRTVMLDNPVGQKKQGGQQQGGQQRGGRSRWTAQLASRAAQRRLGLYQLQTEGLTYESVQPLYRSWQQYMRELLPPGVADAEARLYAADLHGCLIRVAQTADRRYQGLCGIVVKDTANTLQLVTPDADRYVVVPKHLCTWEFELGLRRVVTLLGPGLVRRGSGIGSSGTRPKTLRDAIRGQQQQQQQQQQQRGG